MSHPREIGDGDPLPVPRCPLCGRHSVLEPCPEAGTPPPPGVKADDGKQRFDLIPPKALAALVRVLTFGARKYAPDNWRKVENRRSRYFAAAMRHAWAWWSGETNDAESGEHHLAHALCCLAFLLDEDLS